MNLEWRYKFDLRSLLKSSQSIKLAKVIRSSESLTNIFFKYLRISELLIPLFKSILSILYWVREFKEGIFLFVRISNHVLPKDQMSSDSSLGCSK